MNTSTIAESAPLHVQIASLCNAHGLDFTVAGCEDEDHSLWTISANGWGVICKELCRKEAYWFLKGFLLANPEVYVSQKTLRKLENATAIEVLQDNDWYREITIEEAVETIRRGGYAIVEQNHIVWDVLSECWVQTGDYRIELRK